MGCGESKQDSPPTNKPRHTPQLEPVDEPKAPSKVKSEKPPKEENPEAKKPSKPTALVEEPPPTMSHKEVAESSPKAEAAQVVPEKPKTIMIVKTATSHLDSPTGSTFVSVFSTGSQDELRISSSGSQYTSGIDLPTYSAAGSVYSDVHSVQDPGINTENGSSAVEFPTPGGKKPSSSFSDSETFKTCVDGSKDSSTVSGSKVASSDVSSSPMPSAIVKVNSKSRSKMERSKIPSSSSKISSAKSTGPWTSIKSKVSAPSGRLAVPQSKSVSAVKQDSKTKK